MQRSHVAARRGGAGIAALLAGLVLALLLPALAHAVPPLRVTDVVTDTTGRVDRVADIEAAAERLRDETGAGFYYIVVDRFDDPADGFDWASEVAERSALGDDDAIVYVSLGQNDFGLNVSSAMALTTGDVRDIELAVGERLDRGEYGEAGIVAADAIRAALVGADGGDGASPEGPGPGQLIFAAALLVAALTAVVLVSRARKRKAAAAEEDVEARRAARLQDASQRLVRSDDLIRSAQEELGFAEAGFGAEAVGPFRAALDEAQGLAHEAFDLQAKLLDHIPDSPQQRDEWITGIVHRTERADGLLRAEIERFGELRGRQERAPELLAAVERRLGEAGSRLDGAGARVDRIRPGLEPAAIAPFDADLEQARRLVDLARDEAGNAAQGLAAGAVGPAVVDIGDAESALVQFEQLVEGLDREAGRVESAPATIAAETTALRQDLGRLQQLHRDASGRFPLDPQLPALIAETTRLVDGVDGAGGRHPNPLGTLERLGTAAAAVGTALTGALGAREQYDRAAARLPQALAAARAEFDAATTFITTRRGAVSSTPRTRLDQAGQQLSRAESLAGGDPPAALAAANEATELARAALRAAQQEVDSVYAAQRPAFGGGAGYGDYRNGYGRSGAFDDLGSAILGGIIGGILSDGGGSRRNDRDRGGFAGFGGSGGSGSSGGWFGGGSRSGSRGSRGSFGSSGGGRRRTSSGGGFRSSSGGGFRSSGGGRRR